MSETQTIELTKKQFLTLLKTVYIGNWIANAQKIPSDNEGDEYQQMENLFFSYAEKFGYEKYVDHQADDGTNYYPTRFFEEETDVRDKIEDYVEKSFWDELVDRLVTLHIFKEYGNVKIGKMKKEEYWELLDKYTEKYLSELEKNGLDSFVLNK